MGGQGFPGMMPPQPMGGQGGMGSASVGGGVPGSTSMGSSMGFTPTPAYGDSMPLGPGQSGGMGPMPAGLDPGKQVPGAAAPSPALGGYGQTQQAYQNGVLSPFGQNAQGVGGGTTSQGSAGTAGSSTLPSTKPMGAPSYQGGGQASQGPLPPVQQGTLPPAPRPPMPMGQQNRMRVHNPTGDGTQQASIMAAAQRPAPGNRPVKAQGPLPPSPSPIPGRS